MRIAGLEELRDLFMRLAGISSPSGEERELADFVTEYVGGLGLAVEEDASAPGPSSSGNLLIRVTGRGHGLPLALCAHLDTVPTVRAPKVICEGGIVRTDGETILGADDKAAVAVLLLLVRDLAADPPPADLEVLLTAREEIGLQGAKAFDLAALRAKVFAGWPEERGPIKPELTGQATQGGLRLRMYAFSSQPDVNLLLFVLQDPKVKRPEEVLLTVLDTESWTNSSAKQLWLGGGTPENLSPLRQEMQSRKLALAFFAPRGVEPGKLLSDPKEAIHVRRRYMLLGQTLDGMRVWDIRCAAQAVKALPEFKKTPLHVRAQAQMAVNVAYAALFQPELAKLELENVPASHTDGPDYLNVLKVWDLPQLWATLGERADVRNP